MDRPASLRANIRNAYVRHGRSLRHMGFWALAVYYFGRSAQSRRSPVLRKLGGKAYGLMQFFLEIGPGMIVSREATIGQGLHLVHGWNIKIHPASVIGDRVGIMHDVTLGTTPDDPGAPTIGNDAFIGAGAILLGAVKIGDGARVASNSLVIADVPPGATAVGVPARVIQYTGRPGPATSTAQTDDAGRPSAPAGESAAATAQPLKR